jgi:adenosylcobalamin-dependent ribonucleoside-diphosphate reductase
MAQTLHSENGGRDEVDSQLPKMIIKSSGTSQPFDIRKLELAVVLSLGNCKDSEELKKVLIDTVLKRIRDKVTTSTHYINDIIETYLLRNKHYDVLQKYIDNRFEKNKVYSEKVNLLGTALVTAPSYNRKELDHFSVNQIQIAANRYLQRDMKTGDITESMTGWFERVASHVVLGSVVYDPEVYDKDGNQPIHDTREYNERKLFELSYKSFGPIKIDVIFKLYKKLNDEHKMKYDFQVFSYKVWDLAYPDRTMSDKYHKLYQKYFQYMYQGIFEPNTPTLMNAGTERPRCSACFVLEVGDNMEEIGSVWRDAALIYQGAGGFGTNISSLRPKGSNVGRVFGAASGPINLLLEMIDKVTDVVKSGGCFIGSTLIATADYGAVPIKDIKPDTNVYSYDKEKGFVLRKTKTGSWLTKKKSEVWKLVTDKGLTVFATPDHKFMTRPDKEYTKLKDLKIGAPLMVLSRYIKDGEWIINLDYYKRNGKDQLRAPEHQWMAQQLGIQGEHIHHKDGDHLNNITSNIQGMSESEHLRHHDLDRLQKNIHPFQHLTEEQKQKSVEGYKKWRNNLKGKELEDFLSKTTWQLRESNDRRLEDGTHNFLTNCPSKDPEKKIIMQKSRIANSLWKAMSEGFQPTKENWEEISNKIGLYRLQRFTINKITQVFGSFENALQYTNERNHRVVSIGFSHYEDVYDMEVEDTHNFVVCDEDRRGVVVSNSRRGANMAIMDYNFPQIEEFITMKKTPGYLENFNVSVMFDSDFWKHYDASTDYDLKFKDKTYGKMNAKTLMENIAVSAWSSAEPGVLFKDNANRANPLIGIKGELKSTNPCSEQYLYDGESCTLGSINLAKLVREDGTFDWDGYVQIIHETTRFLNDVLEINQYPTPHIEEESNKVRRIGLGIMGLADLFFLLKIPYNSQEGFWMMEELSKTLYIESVKTSIDLAEERGSCYWYDKFIKSGETPAAAVKRSYGIPDNELIDISLGTEYTNKLIKHGIRNMWTTTIAPTGTISMIADCSSGLEPIFSLVFSKITTAGKYYYTSELFKKALIDAGIYSQQLLEKVEKNYGSCQGIDEISKEIQKVFLTAMDLHWMDHVVAQSVWQNWIDNSISKTINMPYNVTVDDVKNAYILAHELGLKGIALFRDGSRNEQVLHVGSNVQSNKNEQNVQRDTPGTETILQAPTKNQVERKIPPSRYAMNYIRERVPEKLMVDLTIHAGKVAQYLEKGDECPSCKEQTLIKDSGCNKCVKCGYASCSVA